MTYQEWLQEVDSMIPDMASLGPDFETNVVHEIGRGWNPREEYEVAPNDPYVGLESLMEWLFDNGALEDTSNLPGEVYAGGWI